MICKRLSRLQNGKNPLSLERELKDIYLFSRYSFAGAIYPPGEIGVPGMAFIFGLVGIG